MQPNMNITKPNNTPVSVKVKDVYKSYKTQAVLKGVSFEVQAEEIFVIMGPSGAGKSVLLKNIAGLERVDSGKILINGNDSSNPKTRENIVIGLVFQAGALFNSINVYDNLAFYPREHRLYNKDTIRQKVEYALEILSLGDAAYKLPSELSGGMRKRVAIARALVMEPQLLLYDEPTSELDPEMSATISEIIAIVRNQLKITSIVVSHDNNLATGIADRIAILIDGNILTIQPPNKLNGTQHPRIRELLNPKIDIQNPHFQKRFL
jgi:phospholipid/cholesterol/gamma-HCH transport system ATP-binding protein